MLGLTMKRQLLAAGMLCFAPAFAYNAHAQTDPNTQNQEEETSEEDTGNLSSSGVSQRTSLQGVYISESGVKLNTIYLKGSSASGIYAEQIAHIGDAAVVSSNVDINRIAVHSGDISSSVITQSTYMNGVDIQNSSLELNRVVLN
jgi:hypothetical protein